MNLNNIVGNLTELSSNLGKFMTDLQSNMSEDDKKNFNSELAKVNGKKVMSDLEKANEKLYKLMNNGS